MPIVEQQGSYFMKIKVTNGLLNFFNQHRIRTTDKKAVHRWKEGDIIGAYGQAHLYSHVMLLNGQHITQLQSFSYSFAPLDQFLTAGRYCSISWNVRIMGPHHGIHLVTSSEILYRKTGFFADTFEEFEAEGWSFFDNPQRGHVRIGHDVWIGQDVLLKGGITIGTGAVIGAGAVVTRDVAPYEVVGGVPARTIKFRFDEETRAALLASEWWRYAVPQLSKLPWDQPVEFLKQLNKAREDGSIAPFESDLGLLRDIVEATD